MKNINEIGEIIINETDKFTTEFKQMLNSHSCNYISIGYNNVDLFRQDFFCLNLESYYLKLNDVDIGYILGVSIEKKTDNYVGVVSINKEDGECIIYSDEVTLDSEIKIEYLRVLLKGGYFILDSIWKSCMFDEQDFVKKYVG